MIFRRKIRYQLEYYKRLLWGYCRCVSAPAWIHGKMARYAYLTLLVCLCFGYICQVSVASGSGYKMRDLQKQVNGLKSEIQKINVEVAGYNAMPNLEQRVAKSGMVAVANIKYISSADISVAKR